MSLPHPSWTLHAKLEYESPFHCALGLDTLKKRSIFSQEAAVSTKFLKNKVFDHNVILSLHLLNIARPWRYSWLSDVERIRMIIVQSSFLVRSSAVSALEIFSSRKCCGLPGTGRVTGELPFPWQLHALIILWLRTRFLYLSSRDSYSDSLSLC